MIYFLQNNLNSFDQVTLNKMAKESFSSTSSVLRFCKKLGFDGFKDFKLQLIREASISGQDLDFNLPFSPDDSVECIWRSKKERRPPRMGELCRRRREYKPPEMGIPDALAGG